MTELPLDGIVVSGVSDINESPITGEKIPLKQYDYQSLAAPRNFDIADEPVASLDPVLSHSILKYLEQLNKEDKLTVLCSLHFLDLVHRYATRAIALKDGQLVFEGLPNEIDDAQFKAIYGKEAERVSII